jgi:flagellar hook assembly protein FlgD
METPNYFSVEQNFPNPFNGATNILYSIHENCNIKLTIYDILGSEVITLSKGFHKAGKYSVIWEGNNFHGTPIPSGIYYYSLNTVSGKTVDQSVSLTKKLIYLK